MMRLTLLIGALSFSIWARAESKIEESHGKKYLIMSNVTMIEENSSRHHRIDKDYQATALVFGIGPSVSKTYGVHFGKYLDIDSVLLLEITGGTNDWSSSNYSGTSGTKQEISSSSIGLHYKHFTGNSFYLRIGADYRILKYKNTSLNSDLTRDTRSFEGDSIAANFQIGNQWQWESFTLGCDWIGYSAPLTSNIRNFEVVSSLDYEHRWAKEDADMYIKKGHFNLLRFYMGTSF